MAQKGFYYDMAVCTHCKACQITCKDKNNLKIGTLFRKVYDFEGGSYPKPWSYHMSMACNHCDHPKCVENCPTGALSKRKEDGIVTPNKDKCIGCRLCTWSCPYGAPQYIEAEGKTGKCDMCVDLQEKGEEPACVAACPLRALQVGDIDELRQKYGSIADVKGLPDSKLTSPNLVINPNQEARK